MPIATLNRTVNAPHAYVWDWLADFGALDQLHPPGNLVEFSCEGNRVGCRRFARFKPELQIEGQIIERLDVLHAPHVLAYSIVENYPLPMRDYMREEARFRMVELRDPSRFEHLVAAAERGVVERHALYEQLAQIRLPQEDDVDG